MAAGLHYVNLGAVKTRTHCADSSSCAGVWEGASGLLPWAGGTEPQAGPLVPCSRLVPTQSCTPSDPRSVLAQVKLGDVVSEAKEPVPPECIFPSR